MEELMQKLSGYLDAAAGVITEYAPQAVDAALFVVRIDAIWSIAVGALLSVATWAWISQWMKRVVGPTVKLIESNKEKLYGKRQDPFGHVMVCVFVGLPGAVILCVLALGRVLSLYNWIAAFDPTLGLVYKAAQSAGLL